MLDLMDRLPCTREENESRLEHTRRNGHVLVLRDGEKISGIAELYRMSYAPDYPVGWPVDDPNGKILYCYSAACRRNRIKELIKMAKQKFHDCVYIAWHRDKKNHKLYLERI